MPFEEMSLFGGWKVGKADNLSATYFTNFIFLCFQMHPIYIILLVLLLTKIMGGIRVTNT